MMSLFNSSWCAPNKDELPQFILVGAMKSGTSSLHHMLDCHPDVFIPGKELHFFDMDDVCQHPDFIAYGKQKHYQHRLDIAPEFYWHWYTSQFKNVKKASVLGEDSPTYLASELAIQRIALQRKPIKLLVLLRHPTERAYSHYWHMVKAGRAMFDFETTLKKMPGLLLGRSAYKTQLDVLYRYIPKHQVKVMLFEHFVQNPAAEMHRLCDFLHIDYEKLPKDAFTTHVNHAVVPKFVRLHRLKARLLDTQMPLEYINRFPSDIACELRKQHSFMREGFNAGYKVFNPLIKKKPPKINPHTRALLDAYFYKQMAGLDELLEQDVLSRWFV